MRLVWCFGIALGLTALIVAVASIPRLSAVGVALAPGMLLAALLFPEGAHSDWPMTYLMIAGLLDAVIFTLLIMWISGRIRRFRSMQEHKP